mgnify:CR=1 FL=1
MEYMLLLSEIWNNYCRADMWQRFDTWWSDGCPTWFLQSTRWDLSSWNFNNVLVYVLMQFIWSCLDLYAGIKKLRFKPAYNPYTEPSMEIFRCSSCWLLFSSANVSLMNGCLGVFLHAQLPWDPEKMGGSRQFRHI